MVTSQSTESRPSLDYEAVIGLEVHAQLETESKMFCSCSSSYVNSPPNTHVCPVCLGMPGALPVINRKAIEYTIMTGLALNCTIAEQTKFDRKNYPYPDLMKGYQISQYDQPLCRQGWLTIQVDGADRKIRLTRVHLEEDTARLLHKDGPDGERYSQVDVNRSGTPLMEVVGEPDLRSAEEARLYLVKLRTILQYLGVSTGNMEEGSFRCDANISIRPVGSEELNVRVEVKNMNSFRGVYRALNYEIERQIRALNEGGRIIQETRGWVEGKGITVSQRSKEYAHDYRYFPEPDLPPMVIDRAWVNEIRDRLPELPDARLTRFISQYRLVPKDAEVLVNSKPMADFFEECVAQSEDSAKVEPGHRARAVGTWVLGDFSKLLNARGMEIRESKVSAEALSEMLDLIDNKTLSGKMAKGVFEEMFDTGQSPGRIVKEKGLLQMTDSNEISGAVAQALENNPDAVSDFLSGKEQVLTFLVGQVMKATRGRANPAMVNSLLREQLQSRK